MLGLLLYEFTSAESRLRIDEFVRTESGSTLLALITISTFSTTAWACAGNVTVCEEGLCLFVIVLLAHLLYELALIIQFAKIICRILMVSL